MSCGSPSIEMLEDKKCRICDFADTDNINIFTASDKNLRMKICTVYPIVLYRNDPLPKNICKKCVTTVSTMFNEIQKVAKLQNKWIQNVRTNQPRNNYIHALNLLKNSNEAVRNVMNSTFNEVHSDEAINRLILNALNEAASQEETKGNSICMNEEKTNYNRENIITQAINGRAKKSKRGRRSKNNTENMDIEEEEDDNVALSKIVTNKNNEMTVTSPSPLSTVKCRYCPSLFESLKQLSLHQNVHLSIRIPKLFKAKCLNKNLRRGRLISKKNTQSIRCLNCWRVFVDNKGILEHWSNAECEYYCSICGKDFLQSPKMLREHVSDVHGINYKSLKSQRNRFLSKLPKIKKTKEVYTDIGDFQGFDDKGGLPTVAMTQDMLSTKSTTIVCEEKKASNKALESTLIQKNVKCRICSRFFQNTKACNSHMKVHKPPYNYTDITPLPKVDTTSYINTEKIKDEKPPTPTPPDLPPPTILTAQIIPSTLPPMTNIPNIATHSTEILMKMDPDTNVNANFDASNSSSSSTNPANPSPTNVITKVSTSTAPRGIRMKFVTRRSDLNGMLPSIKVKSLSDLQGFQRNFNLPNPTTNLSTLPLPIEQVQNPMPMQIMHQSMPLEISYDALNVKQNPNYFRFT